MQLMTYCEADGRKHQTRPIRAKYNDTKARVKTAVIQMHVISQMDAKERPVTIHFIFT